MGTFIQKTMMRQFIARPDEGAIIGRMLAGYGELEFFLHLCVAEVLGAPTMSLRVLFRARGEKQRIEIADSVLRPVFKSYDLLPAYKDAYDAMHYCRQLRDQYAHCHWLPETVDGMFFCNLDQTAQGKGDEAILKFFHVDIAILKKQEEYFAY